MAEPINVDPMISKLIQLIEENDKSISESKGRLDGVGTVFKFMLEMINDNIIESLLTSASNDFTCSKQKLIKTCNRIYMFEHNIMHLYSTR